MKKTTKDQFVLRVVIASVLAASAAHAQTPAASDAGVAANGGLDEIVVTASGGDKTVLRSSISVSDVSLATIQDYTPRSEAEILRLIPGIQTSGTAGPGGNANIGVRGIPVSTGGSEYVGLQEDGLPVVLFGDIQFGNNDYWLRFDQNVERVEAVRGGSASTFASQAPGAVINYVSKTGETDGGSAAIGAGLDYRETRLDFDYGGHATDTVRYHIGGFYREGSGPTDGNYTASRGYQIKANITKELADGKGFFRLNFKHLDDMEPTNTSMPLLANLNGSGVSSFSQLGPLDARRYSSNGIYNRQFTILNQQGNLQQVNNEGIHPVATAVGGQFHFEFDNHVSVNDNFRQTSMSGVFANQWTHENLTANVLGATVNGQTVGSIVYAAGPHKGQNYTSPYINGAPGDSAQAYVQMKDMGSFANDLQFTGKLDFTDAGGLTAKAGWFHMAQHIAMDWRLNTYFGSLNSTHDSVPLDLFTGANGTGTQLTANGLQGFNNQWGGCCGGRTYDTTYTDDAPYLDLDWKIGKLSINPSVRIDSMKAEGSSYAGTAIGTVTVKDGLSGSGPGAILPAYNTNTLTPVDTLNYTRRYTSWSVGALYELNDDTSLFARASRGGRFNADRQLYGGNFNADGSLNQKGQAIGLNYLEQQEIGIKNRGGLMGGRYSAEGTVFHSTLTENNYDFTRPSHGLDPNISNKYKSVGLEFTGTMNWGNWFLFADMTYTKATLENLGTVPNSIPKFGYRLSPSYDMGTFAGGFTLLGQTSTYGDDQNKVSIPESHTVSAFLKYRPFTQLELALNVNNLFNFLGPAGGGYIQQGISSTQGIYDNSVFYGRTTTLTARYKF